MNEDLTHAESRQMTTNSTDLAAETGLPVAAPIVLLVDDDDGIREILRRLLSREAYSLIEAENGIAALTACQQSPVDLILLDVMMPMMDGLMTCAKIRELPNYAHTPILMLTVLKDTDAINRAFEAGATDYLTKPIDPTVLRPRVRHLLRVTQAETRQRQIADDLAQRVRELAALDNAGRALTSSLELEQVLAAIIREIQDLLKADRAAVLLRDATTDDLVFAAAAGENSEKLIGTRLAINHGIAGWVARERQSALIQEAYQDPRFWDAADAQTGYVTHSVAAVPIKYRGAVWGVIEAINKHDGVFAERDRQMLEALAGSAAIALANARLYQAAREQTQRLKESQTRLIHSEKMSALGRLAASLTHEINNPLQALRSGLTLIQAEVHENADPAEVLRDLQLIDQEVKRISDLMLRLREFSRPVQLATRPTDLHVLLEKIFDLTGKQMERYHIRVELHRDPAVPLIIASPDQLTQVFMNLIFNAIDAMPDGGVLTITTVVDRSRADFPAIRIDVADTGVGITSEVLPRIFEPFYTTKPDGTGLGLSISFEIVKSLGGEITAVSQPGAGTTFTVVLPLREP